MIKLVEMLHGSHLYGTASSTSDLDYKGVALTPVRNVLLGRIPKILESQIPEKAVGRKNAVGDVDRQIFSLHNFIAMALKGETVSIDMLHAPQEKCSIWTNQWADLVANRHRFYTRNMVSLIGYARSQAAKYGLRGSRLAAAKAAVATMENANLAYETVGGWFDCLYLGEHTHWYPGTLDKHNGLAMYEVCGMKFQETAKLAYVRERLHQFINRYGERAKMAERNEGIDWKAISHAFRAAFQMKAILTRGAFTYPLPETELLIAVKKGQFTYTSVGPQLEDVIDEVEKLAQASTLPEKPDVEWAENFVVQLTERSLRPEGL